MTFEVIDFHTHPFAEPFQNICAHKEHCDMGAAQTERDMRALGVSKICGSVLRNFGKVTPSCWDDVHQANVDALKLRDFYGDFYEPGIHVHPDYVAESCREIEDMAAQGVKLIGELVPYGQGWKDYSCAGMDKILDCARAHNMIVSFHSMGEDEMDRMVEKHRDVVFVAAHPGEYGEFKRHMERMKKSENYYLDLSGYGIFRHGMLRHSIDLFGPERFIYGSDFPTCNPAMYLGGVLLDFTITDAEKKLILAENAKRLLAGSAR